MGLDKQMALRSAVSSITERWGSRVLRQPHASSERNIAVISTGFPVLDRALRIGGLPRGHITYISGTRTSGMTTLALKAMAEAQKEGDFAVYVDVSSIFDASYAKCCGVDFTKTRLVRPRLEHYCNVFDIIHTLAQSRGAGIIVLDASQVALHQLGDQTAINRLSSQLSFTPCAVVILARLAPANGYSLPAHQTAIRMKLQRTRWLKRVHDVQGYRVKVEITRNRFGAPHAPFELTIGFSGVVKGDGL